MVVELSRHQHSSPVKLQVVSLALQVLNQLKPSQSLQVVSLALQELNQLKPSQSLLHSLLEAYSEEQPKVLPS